MIVVSVRSWSRSQFTSAATPSLTGSSTVVTFHLPLFSLMGLASRRILPLAFIFNLTLNIIFLINSGTLRLPYFPGLASNQLAHNGHKGTNTRLGWTTELAQQPLEPVSFSMVMYGESSAREGLLALKTVLMHLSRPAEFHIICSPDAIPIIQSKLNLFSR